MPELADALYDFFGGLQHHDLLTGGHTDHSVGSFLDSLDQIAIQDHGRVVETCDVNHDLLSPITSAIKPSFRERYPEGGQKYPRNRK